MSKRINEKRREYRINILNRVIQQFKSEGQTRITSVMVHDKILELNSDEATIRQIANRLRCWQKRLNIKPKERTYVPAPGWHGGSEKITIYEIL